jgi:transcriptional regulator with XRE-family HTH domain
MADLRIRIGLSQREMALKIQVSQPTIVSIEKRFSGTLPVLLTKHRRSEQHRLGRARRRDGETRGVGEELPHQRRLAGAPADDDGVDAAARPAHCLDNLPEAIAEAAEARNIQTATRLSIERSMPSRAISPRGSGSASGERLPRNSGTTCTPPASRAADDRTCHGPDAFKAWSPNLGHDEVSTTFKSYGDIPAHRQRDLIRGANTTNNEDRLAMEIGRQALAAQRRLQGNA